MVYAIVKAGSHQEKVSVGDTIVVDKLAGDAGDTVSFEPVMVVDGDKLTTEASKLKDVTVSGEIVDDATGPKVNILKFKNKTGYRKRMGHRQKYTVVKITEIA